MVSPTDPDPVTPFLQVSVDPVYVQREQLVPSVESVVPDVPSATLRLRDRDPVPQVPTVTPVSVSGDQEGVLTPVLHVTEPVLPDIQFDITPMPVVAFAELPPVGPLE